MRAWMPAWLPSRESAVSSRRGTRPRARQGRMGGSRYRPRFPLEHASRTFAKQTAQAGRNSGEASMRLSGLAAIIAGLSWLLVGGNSAAPAAEILPEPTEPVVLEISGRIGNSHADGVARFDRR